MSFRSSSTVERATVNRDVPGSNPGCGAGPGGRGQMPALMMRLAVVVKRLFHTVTARRHNSRNAENSRQEGSGGQNG